MNVFVSYSHKDEEYKDNLEAHASSLRHNGTINIWTDRKITAGTDWKGKIDDNIRDADIILLLISPDFMNSGYCYDVEMQEALKRYDNKEAKVLPIILRHVDWHDAPFAKIQVLPKDGKPISSWGDKDEAFKNVIDGIKQSIRERNILMELNRKSFEFDNITISKYPVQRSRVDKKKLVAK